MFSREIALPCTRDVLQISCFSLGRSRSILVERDYDLVVLDIFYTLIVSKLPNGLPHILPDEE